MFLFYMAFGALAAFSGNFFKNFLQAGLLGKMLDFAFVTEHRHPATKKDTRKGRRKDQLSLGRSHNAVQQCAIRMPALHLREVDRGTN